jgi:hypothetical protein
MPPYNRSTVKSKGKSKPFRFLALPVEIRLQIYEAVLRVDRTIDLGAYNHAKVTPLLGLFFVCRQAYEEAYPVFYGINTFRLYSVDGKFIHTRKPLLSRFPSHYRAAITTLELRLGPNWNKPPIKSWSLIPKHGIKDCTSLRRLKVFVELDPEDSSICREWMATRTSYTDFSVHCLTQLLDATAIREVTFDGFPSVHKNGPLLRTLREACHEKSVKISYGLYRGWAREKDDEGEDASASNEMSILNVSFEHLLVGGHGFQDVAGGGDVLQLH